MPKYRVVRHEITQPSDPSYKIIALTHGQNTMVDTIDYPWLNQFNWFARWSPYTKSFYAARQKSKNGEQHEIQMSREILQCDPGEEADHRDRNTLNNRRYNLRKATKSQNGSNRRKRSTNTSGHIGVYWMKDRKKWRATICHKRIVTRLGLFDSKEEASRVRDEAAKKLHGEFAELNNITPKT